MAGLADGRRPTKRSKAEASASIRSTTTIHSLGDDLLLAVFLRLPSLAALVRAALACRAWRRAVASSPAFRARFRATHGPPFLGLFFAPSAPAQAPNVPAFPSFVPSRPRDRDMAAAVRGGDFFLTSLQDRPHDEQQCWDVMEICGGHCLLMNWDDGLFAVLNPLMRTTPGSGRLCHGWTSQNLSGQMTLAAGS